MKMHIVLRSSGPLAAWQSSLHALFPRITAFPPGREGSSISITHPIAHVPLSPRQRKAGLFCRMAKTFAAAG